MQCPCVTPLAACQQGSVGRGLRGVGARGCAVSARTCSPPPPRFLQTQSYLPDAHDHGVAPGPHGHALRLNLQFHDPLPAVERREPLFQAEPLRLGPWKATLPHYLQKEPLLKHGMGEDGPGTLGERDEGSNGGWDEGREVARGREGSPSRPHASGTGPPPAPSCLAVCLHVRGQTLASPGTGRTGSGSTLPRTQPVFSAGKFKKKFNTFKG